MPQYKQFRLPAILALAITFLIAQANMPVSAMDLSIKTHTKFYSFRAKKFHQLSRQMLRRGPSFGRNGRRVWAKAKREYNWKLTYLRSAGKCAVKHAKVRMKITYTLPRLENERQVSHVFQSKWKRVYNILHRHELRHGRNYKFLAKKLTHDLKRLKPQRNCLALKRSARRLDDKLHNQDIRRNRRLESGERSRLIGLQRRIERG